MGLVLPSNAKELVNSSGVLSLPDNPSSRNFNAREIKASIQRVSNLILSFLEKMDESNAYGKALVKGVSELPAGDELAKYEDGTIFALLEDGDVTFYSYDSESDPALQQIFKASEVAADVATLESYFTGGKANKAIADEDGNNIKASYVHKTGNETISGVKTFNDLITLNGQSGNGKLGLYYAYIVTNSKDYFAKAGSTEATASVYKLPYAADSATYTLATTSQVETAKTEAVASAKTYADATFLKPADVVDNLTSSYESKPLSAKQGKALKDALDTLSNYIYQGASNTNIDRLQEVFAFLVNHDDDETLDALLAQKASISAIEIGSIVAGRALADEDGNNIKNTYVNHDDVFAAGFIQISEIDSVPEELQFDANGDVSNPNWTGALTIEYNNSVMTITSSDVPSTLTFNTANEFDNLITNANWTGELIFTY